jgi:nitroreductase
MEFLDVVNTRRMTRCFTGEPVGDDVIDRIIHCGLRAPSAGYSQGTSMLVLRTDEERQLLWNTHSGSESRWSSSTKRGVLKAPLVVVVLASKQAYLDRYAEDDKGWTDRDERRWPAPYWYVDAGCTAMLLLLAAVDEGLGALLFGMAAGDVPRFRLQFGIPEGIDFVGCVAIGHPDPEEAQRDLRHRRRPAGERVHLGRW